MVHALNEAWRVLVAHGYMIDVRPLCIDVPLEIVFREAGESAGMLDLSPDIKRDINSGRAIETILAAGIFKEEKLEFFDFAYYWNTLEEMQEDLDENWKDEIVIPEAVLMRAQALFKKQRSKPKIRIRARMKLGIYEKQA